VATEDDAEPLIVAPTGIYGSAHNHARLQRPQFGRSGRPRAVLGDRRCARTTCSVRSRRSVPSRSMPSRSAGRRAIIKSPFASLVA